MLLELEELDELEGGAVTGAAEEPELEPEESPELEGPRYIPPWAAAEGARDEKEKASARRAAQRRAIMMRLGLERSDEDRGARIGDERARLVPRRAQVTRSGRPSA